MLKYFSDIKKKSFSFFFKKKKIMFLNKLSRKYLKIVSNTVTLLTCSTECHRPERTHIEWFILWSRGRENLCNAPIVQPRVSMDY